jgi:asparagine synthase (glutamine-hydrolysing)
MCGIAGFFQPGGFQPGTAQADLARMAAALLHRGPDGEGEWIDAEAGVAFCHRRLAIIDLSPLGSQPMRSHSGRFTITFNGEVYNYRELRAELSASGFSFRSESDTEVLLAAVERWGVHEALRRCRAMLAFALWDEAEQVLWLARDRFGEKPLYYGELGAGAARKLIFGSELKALRQHSAWNADIDRNALALYLQRDYVPAPHSIFHGIRKLRPGCTLRVTAERGSLRVVEEEYWRPSSVALDRPGSVPNESDALQQVDAALQDAVRLQMVADVPVGAFLSGGIDSSLVVSYMQRAASRAVRTFSIGFEEESFNEAPFARRVAEHLGTRHTELIVTSGDALQVIPRLARIYDEPFADSSQIPTYLVAQLARRDVTVALSGDAGDELFGGYSRYLEVRNRWRRMQRMPAGLRSLTARTLESLPGWALGAATAPYRVVAHLQGRHQVAERVQERARAFGARSLPELYDAMTSFWQPCTGVVLGGAGEHAGRASQGCGDPAADPIAHMMYADTRGYLPDDILVKVDRAAMAVSLETRVPLLDPGVAAAAWSIPTALHLRDGKGKWILRTLLERHVPRALFDRPKSGFAIPLDRWLRSELKEWAAALLAPAKLRQQGYLAADVIQRRWEQHQSGQMSWSFHLWGVLMFQSWLEDFKRAGTPPAVSEPRRRAVCINRHSREGMGIVSRKRRLRS